MNTGLYKVYGLISLFPIWIFRGNLDTIDILTLLVVFLIVPYFVHTKLIKFYNLNKKYFTIYIWHDLMVYYRLFS